MSSGKLRIGCRFGPVFDLEMGEGFSFNDFIADIRAKGFIFNGVLYIPHDAISFITLLPSGDPVIEPIYAPGAITPTRQ